MTLQPWFDRWPALLARQLSALEDAGIRYRIDEGARARGTLVIELFTVLDGEDMRLRVDFPSTSPYTRFEIQARSLDLRHHQHPFSKTLCFIDRGTVNWRESDTVADYVVNRLPLVLHAGRSAELADVEGLEQHQAEPFTEYYDPFYEKDAIVLVDGAVALDPALRGGELVVGVREDAGVILRGAVIAVKDTSGRVIAQADDALAACYPRRLRARWVRRDEPIREPAAQRFERVLVESHPHLARPEWQLVRGWKVDVVGVVFRDEIKWRETGDNWIFLVRGEELKDPGRRKSGRYLARAARAGRADLAARIPELRTLGDAKVVLVGLGGLGAPSALDLARAGSGELRVLDGDIVDAGTTVRWPFGIPIAGLRKVDVIKDFIREHYPYVNVRTWHRRLGLVREEKPTDLEILDQMLDGASLVYDASAEVGIQHLLADLARERGIPYICVSSTAGAWGGLLIRIRPKKTEGCWVCSQWALQDKTIPTPPADPKGGVQPLGCADPTFTGSSFDLGAVSSAGVRLAVSTLCAGIEGGYPDVDLDVGVVSLRDAEGRAIPAEWKTFALKRHSSCDCGNV